MTPTHPGRRRGVLLFARSPREEGRSKELKTAAALFVFARQRIAAAVAAMPGVDLIAPAQRGRGFGERLLNALADARAAGYDDLIAVPADAPELGASQIAQAFGALAARDVALGPSPDGGVYLIGVSAAVDLTALLSPVRWRTSSVLVDLMAAAPGAFLLDDRIADVDGRADLAALGRRPDLDPALGALVLDLTARPALPRHPAHLSAASAEPSPRGAGRAPPGPLTAH